VRRDVLRRCTAAMSALSIEEFAADPEGSEIFYD
jgi:hypothetical protein